LHRRLGATMVYVTHDQEEAMTLGDRVAVLRDGVLQQVAPPMELYRRPANEFVAGFIGSPAMNFFEGALHREAGVPTFAGRGFTLALPGPGPAGEALVKLGVRPHDLALADGDGPDVVAARIAVVEPVGSGQIVHGTTAGGERVIAVAPPDLRLTVEQAVHFRIPPHAAHLFRAEDGARLGSDAPEPAPELDQKP
ncbi:MAG: ABC transporter ATP-binding protein, partial [Gemmatimonadota bacterium]